MKSNEKITMISVILLVASASLVQCLPPPHPAVVAVRRQEEHLHPHLRSPALRNPRLLEILPLTSLLHSGETPIYEREADNVSRQEIYNILSHAGFVPRRPLYHQPDPNHRPHERKKSHHHQQPSPGFFEFPHYFQNPDFLQHL